MRREELIAALNELLEAERAGTKIALASIDAAGPGYAALMRRLREDEARWCAMLSRQVRRLDGAPSRKTGAFYRKAMAVAQPSARLALLNRGQGWVVRKLEALTPRVRDDAAHRANIEHANAVLDNDRSRDAAK
jgi:hypothetical protein